MVELGLLYKTSSNKNYLKPNKIVDFKINNPSTINQLKVILVPLAIKEIEIIHQI